MKEHLEKELNRYVIATFDNTTNYLMAKGNCTYVFIDNIQVATKFTRLVDAEEVYKSCKAKYNFDLVIVPLKIKYLLIESEEDD